MKDPTREMALWYARTHPAEAARLVERRSDEEIAGLLQEASVETITAVLSSLEPTKAAGVVLRTPADVRSQAVAQIPTARAAAILRRLDEGARDAVLDSLPAPARNALSRSIAFPEGSAGSLADPSEITLTSDLSAEEALDRLRERSQPIPSRIFVVDRSQRLVGSITPSALLQVEPTRRLDSAQLEAVTPALADAAATILTSPGRAIEPTAVVDREGTLVGVVGEDSLRDLNRVDDLRSLVHPVASMAELYWVGLREVFSGFSSGSRLVSAPDENEHVNN